MISPMDRFASGQEMSRFALEGMQRGLAQAGDAARKLARGDLNPANVVQQIQAGIMVKASAAVMRTADELLGALLDERA